MSVWKGRVITPAVVNISYWTIDFRLRLSPHSGTTGKLKIVYTHGGLSIVLLQSHRLQMYASICTNLIVEWQPTRFTFSQSSLTCSHTCSAHMSLISLWAIKQAAILGGLVVQEVAGLKRSPPNWDPKPAMLRILPMLEGSMMATPHNGKLPDP